MQTTQLIPAERVVHAAEIIDDLPAIPVAPPATPIWERRDLVLGLIAFSGPPGILLLWLSRRFQKRTKLLISLGYFAFTFLLPVALIWYWCHHAMKPLAEALGR